MFIKHGSFSVAILSLFGGCAIVFFQARNFSVQIDRDNESVSSSSQEVFSVNNKATDTFLENLSIQPRPFKPWNTQKNSLPCFPAKSDWLDSNVRKKPTRKGFLFVESSKTDATTGTSITLRIASSQSSKICRVRFSHNTASQMHYHKRIQSKSFLWSLVRDPTERAVSEFLHYQVSWRGVSPSLENFRKYFQHKHNKQLKTLALGDYTKGRQVEAIDNIFKKYNFLGITERMDESAVVLQMLLGLSTSDVMYLPR